MMDEIINKVAQSDLQVLDLADFHDPAERIFFDLKDLLFQEQILREKDFREFIRDHDWTRYRDKNVAIGCTADTIIPSWAFMLLTSKLEPHAKRVIVGDLEMLEKEIYREAISSISLDEYKDAKIIIKGCGDIHVPDFAFAEITRVLKPVAASIMYGEPCSTVPIFKRGK